jgi:hypothetical protein
MAAMGEVRAFRSDDIPRVAALWLDAFHRSTAPAAVALHEYFRDIFFGPCYDPELPSLVYEQPGGAIQGFLGVIPRRMAFRGETIRVAVATQIMVASGARGYAAGALLRRYFAGAQDLSYSDGANEDSERLWRAGGGDIATLYNLAWTRVLRPAGHITALLRERNRWTALQPLLQPASRAFDAAFALVDPRARSTGEEADQLQAEAATPESIGWCIRNLSPGRVLTPQYDHESLDWLLAQAAAKQRHGKLHGKVLRDGRGDRVGWFLYYARRGGIAQVLQFGGQPRRIRSVLQCLFRDAGAQGAVAVSGGFEPRYMKDLARSRARFSWPAYAVVVRSRRPELAQAVHRGDAFLTRLEGEWWARFSDPTWTPPPVPAVAGGTTTSCAASQAS